MEKRQRGVKGDTVFLGEIAFSPSIYSVTMATVA